MTSKSRSAAREERAEPPLRARRAIGVLASFVVAVIAWCAVTIALERLGGAAFLPLGNPRSSPSAADAIWHLATAFILAVPLRDRVAVLLAPALALALDVDHLFGSVFPTVVHRPAHTLLCAALVGLLLFRLAGRAPALLAVGGVLAHIGVDGGGFPLFAPFSLAPVNPGFTGQVAFLIAGTVLFRCALTPVRGLLRWRTVAEIALVVAIVSTVIYAAWPSILPFTQH